MFSQVSLEDHPCSKQNENSRALFHNISQRLTFTTIFKRSKAYQSNSPCEKVQIYILTSSSSQVLSAVPESSSMKPISAQTLGTGDQKPVAKYIPNFTGSDLAKGISGA
jgi:hypothetical protein